MSVLLVTDARSSAGSTLTLIAQDDSCRPVEKCPQSTMGHHGPTLGSGENNLVARSSEGFHHWSSDQPSKIIWSCQQRHHFRQGVLSQDNLIIGRFSPLIKWSAVISWSSDQPTEIIWSCHHFSSDGESFVQTLLARVGRQGSAKTFVLKC